jgi:Mn-containing catalase
MVSASINSLLNGPRKGEDAEAEPFDSPFEAFRNLRNTHHFIVGGNAALVANSMGQSWYHPEEIFEIAQKLAKKV